MLREAGVLSARGAPLERPPKRVVGRSCCRGAYLRGALLGAGSLSGPRDAHLELRADGARRRAPPRRDRRDAKGSRSRSLERRTHAVAYAKSSETIADLLAVAGASETALRLDEHAVIAATRAEANRLANADEANVKRTVDAAQEQLAAIEQLDVDSLPTKLQEIATLRLRHPSLSLAELAAEVPPADHEGRGPSPHGRAAGARRCRIHSGIDRHEAHLGERARGRAGGEAPRTTFPSD